MCGGSSFLGEKTGGSPQGKHFLGLFGELIHWELFNPPFKGGGSHAADWALCGHFWKVVLQILGPHFWASPSPPSALKGGSLGIRG